MRTAIVSDIHGNLAALEAVVADLRITSPDLVLHGGDLADSGSGPVEVVDLIRSLGWHGVAGNTDELLAMPDVFEAFARERPGLENIWAPIREMAAFAREKLGEERLAWLRGLPPAYVDDRLALVHASPASRWLSPAIGAADSELAEAYGNLLPRTVVYGHIHIPFVRRLGGFPGAYVANSGSVGQPHDGDRRAGYLLIDDGAPAIRRVEYDVDRQCRALLASGLPHAEWMKRVLETARPQIP
ncbi:MAG: metallophosphoesterase family protein [Bryobacteraceae bacterium]